MSRTAAASTGCVTSPRGSASATLAGLGTTVMLVRPAPSANPSFEPSAISASFLFSILNFQYSAGQSGLMHSHPISDPQEVSAQPHPCPNHFIFSYFCSLPAKKMKVFLCLTHTRKNTGKGGSFKENFPDQPPAAGSLWVIEGSSANWTVMVQIAQIWHTTQI